MAQTVDEANLRQKHYTDQAYIPLESHLILLLMKVILENRSACYG